MAIENYDGVEIPQELLDEIAGGTISEATKGTVRRMCASYKRNGNDMGRAMEIFRNKIAPGAPFSYDELRDYIEEIWPQL